MARIRTLCGVKMQKLSLVLGAVLMWGCGSTRSSRDDAHAMGGSPTFEPLPTATMSPCVDQAGCNGMRTCRGTACDECLCSRRTEACVSATGCNGTHQCDAQGCGECECAGTRPTWSVGVAAVPVELHADRDGSVVVRLQNEPWLVRYAADGVATPLDLRVGLPWVRSFVLAEDGSIYVAGDTEVGNTAAGVHVDHLSGRGELLASNDLAKDGGLGGFAVMARDPAGKVRLIATGLGRELVTLSPAGSKDVSLPIQGDFVEPSRLAFSADGSALLQGGQSVLWAAKLDLTGMVATPLWRLELAGNFASRSVYGAGIVPTEDGGAFVALGTGWTNAESGLGYYERKLHRVSAEGAVAWSRGDYFEPRIPDPDGLRRASVAALRDSVLLATFLPADARQADNHYLDPAQIGANVARYDKTGKLAESLALPGVIDITPVGGTSAVFLTKTAVVRYDFQPLEVTLTAAGGACSTGSDCVSGTCCASVANAFVGKCSATAKCASGDLCAEDATCDGRCLKSAASGAQGFCSAACSASTDCPRGAFCVEAQCLTACSGPDECPYRGAACAIVSNAEQIMVSVCKLE